MDEFVANKDKEFEEYCYEIVRQHLEYYDQIAHQTSAANPAGLADEFVDWVLNLGA